MQLNRPGRFIAGLIDSGLKIEPGKCPQFHAEFDIRQELTKEGWVQCSGDETILGRITIRNSDGQANKIGCQSLCSALGWDGVRVGTLQTMDHRNKEVQITVDWGTNQLGKPKLEVKWLNPRDHEGGKGIPKATAEQIRDLDAEFGPALRAALGSKPATQTPSKPSAQAQCSPKAPTTQPANTPASAAAEQARRDAWTAFRAINKDLDQNAMAAKWTSAVKSYFDGKPQTMLGAQDWQAFVGNSFSKPMPESPISGEPEFTEEEIPF